MVCQVDAIFSQGAFKPLEPLSLPEGTRVRLSVVEEQTSNIPSGAKVHTPKLARAEDAADFIMEVWETSDADV